MTARPTIALTDKYNNCSTVLIDEVVAVREVRTRSDQEYSLVILRNRETFWSTSSVHTLSAVIFGEPQ